MTDTVNVPRDPTREMTMAGAGCLPSVDGVFGMAGALSANVYRAMLASAPKAEPVKIDSSSGSVYDRLLTFIHDRDDALRGDDRTDPHEVDESVLEIMRIAGVSPEAPKAEQEPFGYAYETIGGDWEMDSRDRIGGTDGKPLYTHTAPSRDELLEALRGLIDCSEEVRDMLASHPAMQGREHMSMGISFNDAIGRAQRAYVAKHKGPQS